jgi:hypothetical protein
MKALIRLCGLLALVGLYSIIGTVCYAQVLETETARPLRAGSFELNSNYEFQSSSEGTERAVPFTFEYGITDRMEILVEPVFGTAILPKVGRRAKGVGDLEVTTSYLFWHESRGIPALMLAAEVKIPSAKNTLIGTGKTDYTGYLIASKRFGNLDTHANFGYTVVGQPVGVSLNNILNFAFAMQYHINNRYEVFGEILGNTSSVPGEGNESSSNNAVIPEAAGGELVGTLGAGIRLGSAIFIYLSTSYDNNSALMFRPGMMMRLERFH